MDYRSPLESIFSVLGGLPQGHDKPIKHALYNAMALLLLFLCCAAAWALYMILEPFIKPLIWALLVGSALHPLKRSLKAQFQGWFEGLEKTNTPILLGVFLLPVEFLSRFSDFVGDNLMKRLKIIVGVAVAVVLVHVFYYYTPRVLSGVVWTCFQYSSWFMGLLLGISKTYVVIMAFLLYFSTIFVVWKPENNRIFHFVAIVMWILASCFIARQFGTFQMPLFVLMQVVLLGGFLYEVYDIYGQMHETESPISLGQAVQMVFSDFPKETSSLDESTISEESEDKSEENIKCSTPQSPKDKPKDPWALDLFEEKQRVKRTDSELSNTSVIINNQGIHVIQKPSSSSLKHDQKKLKRSLSQPQFFSNKRKSGGIMNFTRKLSFSTSYKEVDVDRTESTFYLYSVCWACIVVLFWKNSMLITFLPIPILIYLVKKIGNYLGLWSWLFEKITLCKLVVEDWCLQRHDALVPVPIRGLRRLIDKVNSYLKGCMKESMDTVASCVVILGLIVFLICASIFIALQIYAEAIMLVQMTSNVINQTVVHNPELRQLLPPAWDDTVDSILDNAYVYGREGISKAIKGVMKDVDSAKSEKLEAQILDLWDRVYQSWMSNNQYGPQVTEEAVRNSWDEFIVDLKKSPEVFNINGIVDFIKQNLGTLMSLLESVWSIVKGNIGLVLGSFSAFVSVLLGGGTAVLNFILNVVVFLTTLFYLLNCSGELYKPVELMTNFSKSGSRFGHALEDAINGVFSASFKMASFYGLWTWFIHNLFGVKIVYLPTAFATILGAVPFLGTYWACIPAVLDLWLAQDQGLAAILFAAFQFLPTSIVDTTIYKEIKGGGHPYLTGLAIAGGIFCLGVEGAIMGPLLLCGLYVAIDLSSSLFKESPSEESLNIRFRTD